MKAKVRLLRKDGRLLTSSDTPVGAPAAPRFAGVFSLDEFRDVPSKRTLVRARLVGITAGTESNVLPDLYDARVLHAQDMKMRIHGFERAGNVEYAQTWVVEVQPC
ncbi:MAG: hypothetical protein H7315_08780 [Herminiimonas sp.]|nr:hypothetical protein [Herminiimonas sp.]